MSENKYHMQLLDVNLYIYTSIYNSNLILASLFVALKKMFSKQRQILSTCLAFRSPRRLKIKEYLKLKDRNTFHHEIYG